MPTEPGTLTEAPEGEAGGRPPPKKKDKNKSKQPRLSISFTKFQIFLGACPQNLGQ